MPAENPIQGRQQQSCGVGGPAVMITDHVPAVRFLLITQVITSLRLSQREEVVAPAYPRPVVPGGEW
jgi:hypothetical protein